MIKISIIGAGGHTRSFINLLKHSIPDAKYEILDDSFHMSRNEYISGVKVVGNIKDLNPDMPVLLSVGDNAKREKLYNTFMKQLIKDNLFHKTSYIEENVITGNANQFFANIYINSSSIIGNDNIINTSSIIEHEVEIGNHNHISVGAKICGRVRIGHNCMIGAGSVIIDKTIICDNVIVGSGAVVINDINQSGTYVGAPARKIK